MLRSLALLTAVWFAASPTSALAQTAPAAPDAATITHRWVQAVVDQEYSTAWALLTARSQDYIVNSVATAEKLDPADVRGRFDRTDQSVVSGFWTSFRKSASSLPSLATVNASVVSSDGDTAVVQFAGYTTVEMLSRSRRMARRFCRDVFPGLTAADHVDARWGFESLAAHQTYKARGCSEIRGPFCATMTQRGSVR